jgi:hypothetical protein
MCTVSLFSILQLQNSQNHAPILNNLKTILPLSSLSWEAAVPDNSYQHPAARMATGNKLDDRGSIPSTATMSTPAQSSNVQKLTEGSSCV